MALFLSFYPISILVFQGFRGCETLDYKIYLNAYYKNMKSHILKLAVLITLLTAGGFSFSKDDGWNLKKRHIFAALNKLLIWHNIT